MSTETADSYPVAIYGFQSESGLDKVERAGSYGNRPKKNFDRQNRAIVHRAVQSRETEYGVVLHLCCG